MIPFLGGLLAKVAATAIGGKVKSIVSAVPRWVWIALAVIAVVVAGYLWHQHKAHAATKAAYDSGYAQAMKDIEAKALAIKAKADSLNAGISQLERAKNDAERASISRAASTLSMRGPGAARCLSVVNPGVASSPGGHEPADRPASPAAAGVPADNRQDVPTAVGWNWLVGTGRQCDLDRAEAISWREWWVKVGASWPGNGPQPRP